MHTQRVEITNVSSYQPEAVSVGLDNVLDPLGGLSNFVSPGDRVLFKVNLLSPKPPAAAVTTHPALVEALCKKTLALGAHPVVGDSAGGMTAKGSRTGRALETSGIQKAAQEAGGEVVNFDQQARVKLQGEISGLDGAALYIAREILDADVIISLPKLKTHGYTYFTGAIKNMYGVLPGRQKRELHRHFATVEQFSEMLADLYWAVKPDLAIMDGITGMEGNGPSAGTPRELGLLLASTDGVALDEIACQIIGYKPQQVKQVRIAHEKGYGQGDLTRVKHPGSLRDYQPAQFQLPITGVVENVPPFITRFVMKQFRIEPIIQQDRCTRCGICYQNCPVETIRIVSGQPGKKVQSQHQVRSHAAQQTGGNFYYQVDASNCIECLCCHELCPENAIQLAYRGALAKAYARLRGGR